MISAKELRRERDNQFKIDFPRGIPKNLKSSSAPDDFNKRMKKWQEEWD